LTDIDAFDTIYKLHYSVRQKISEKAEESGGYRSAAAAWAERRTSEDA